MIIELPCYDITIELGGEDPQCRGTFMCGRIWSSCLKDECPMCKSVECYRDCDMSQAEDSDETKEDVESRRLYNAAMDGIESLILAHACAGVDINTPAYVEGIETSVQAAANAF